MVRRLFEQETLTNIELWVTHCSWKKNAVREGTPVELYSSPRISEFIEYCSRNEHAWAILSAKHDLFFPNEKKQNYNMTFRSDPLTKQCLVVENGVVLDSERSSAWMDRLVSNTEQKIRSRDIKSIVFWPGRPRDDVDPLMRVKCYLKFLHAATDGCNIDHRSWREIVEHINASTKSGRGRISLISELPAR